MVETDIQWRTQRPEAAALHRVGLPAKRPLAWHAVCRLSAA